MSAQAAIFFDRDGVLNDLVFNPATGAYEAPQRLADLKPTPGLGSLLKPLQDRGYQFFVVSNQPDAAKGKSTLEELDAIHAALAQHLASEGLEFREFFYCRHHPQGIVPGLSGPCECRKPSPYFVEQAIARYGLDRQGSWFIGDQDSDIQCGQAAGLRTLQLRLPQSASKRGQAKPDLNAENLVQGIGLLREQLP